MLSIRRWGIALLGSCVVAAVAVWRYTPDRHATPGSGRGIDSTPFAGDGGGVGGPAENSPQAPVAASGANTDARSSVATPALVITVCDETDAPVVGAVCRTSALPDADYSGLVTWALPPVDELDPCMTRSVTDLRGEIRFDSPFSRGRSAVAWIFAPSFQATWHLLPEPVDGESAQIRIPLRRAAPIRVQVVGPDQQPMAGATVFACAMSPKADGASASQAARAFRSHRQELAADSTGAVDLQPVDGTLAIWAEAAAGRSAPVLDVLPDRSPIVLRIGSQFTAGGRVSFAPGVGHSEQLQVSAFAWTGSSALRVAQQRIGADGEIRNFVVPIVGDGEYEFVVRGTNAVPARLSCATPAPGAHQALDFILSPASSLAVVVHDSAGPVPMARVNVRWDADGGDAQSALTNDAGFANVTGIHPTSAVEVHTTSRGHVTSHLYQVQPERYASSSMRVQLERGGLLRGRVTHSGDPVEAFQVVFWLASAPRDRVEQSIHQREGRFEIDGVPPGDVLIYANSAEHPRSEVRQVVVSQGGIAEVELELPKALVGRGRVLDGTTAKPVLGAQIQLWNSYRAAYLSPFGPLHRVDSEGRFEIAGFPPGDSRLVVYADGYTQLLHQASGVAGEELDLGVLALQRPQTLSVRLTSNAPLDFTRYASDADGNAPYPRVAFDSTGRAAWPDAGPSLTFVRVHAPDQTVLAAERYCAPGEDWEFVFPLDPGCSLEVEVVDAQGQAVEPPEAQQVRLHSLVRGGPPVMHSSAVGPGGVARFELVCARQVYAEVLGGEERRLAARSLALENGANRHRLVLGGRELTVQVLGPDDQPLEGATLDARAPAGESPWFHLVSTDAQGRHRFTGLGMDRLFLTAQHDRYGAAVDVEVDLGRPRDGDFVIRLDGRGKLVLRLVDGSAPIPGAHLRLMGAQSRGLIGAFTSDEAGIVRHGPLAEGQILVRVEQPGLWTSERTLTVDREGAPQDLQVRRVGDLRLSFTRAGEPAVGVALDLFWSETGESARSWIEQGRLAMSLDGLVSDSAGQVVLRGVPRGGYSWRVPGAPGAAASGAVEVLAGALAERTIELP